MCLNDYNNKAQPYTNNKQHRYLLLFWYMHQKSHCVFNYYVQCLNYYYHTFIENRMKACLQKFIKPNRIMYQPDQWAKRLGEQCEHCGKNLTHQSCISLCKCYYFCHRQCFIKKYQQQIHDQNTQVKCHNCQQSLSLNLRPHFKYDPDITLKKLLDFTLSMVLVFLSVILIVCTLHSRFSVEMKFFLLYVQGLILSLCLYRGVLNLRDIFFRKFITIQDVISTHLDIQTSAFKDIDYEQHEQTTKQCLIQVKK